MARSHYRGTVYGNLTTGTKPLPGAAVRLYHPDTGQPWALPVYPDAVNGVPHAMPILTDPVGEWEVWADEPARVRASVDHPSFYSVGEVVEIRPDPETAATDEDVAESVEDHEAKEDPHDQYLTEEEGNLLYKPLPWEPDLSDYYTRGEADDEFLDQDEADLRYEQLSRKGLPLGYAPLDFAGFVPNQYLPPLAITETFVCISEAEMLALPAQQGDVAVRLDTTENYILRVDPATVLENWTKLAASTTAGNTSVLRREEFTPSPLATTVTLAAPPTTVHAVSRNGVGQSEPAGHYTVSGLVLTFTDPFELGERVAVVYEVGSTVPAPVNGYTKEESDLRYEPIDTMYTKGESDLRYQPIGSYSLTSHNHDASYLALSGGILTGGLSAPAVTIATKPVNVSPDSGNALVWRSNGFYSSGSGGNVTVVNREEFFPAAAATTVTLAQAPSEILSVSRNGVEQFASAGDYSVAGAVVTFTTAFVAGERVSVLSEVGTSVPVDAYTTAQSEARYVNVTGDNLTGPLTFGGDVTLQRTGSGALRVDKNLGVGVDVATGWLASRRALQIGQRGAIGGDDVGANFVLASNVYYDGTIDRALAAGGGSQMVLSDVGLDFYAAATPAASAGAPLPLTHQARITKGGMLCVGSSLNPDVVWNSAHTAVRVGTATFLWGGRGVGTGTSKLLNNSYFSDTSYRAIMANQAATRVEFELGMFHVAHAPAVAANAAQNFVNRFEVDSAGPGVPNGGWLNWARSDNGASAGWRYHPGGSDLGLVYVFNGVTIGTRFDYDGNIYARSIWPGTDSYHSNGQPSLRWTTVYATNGAINTSIYAVKEDFAPLDPAACAQAVLETDWVAFAYRPPAYQEPPEPEGEDAPTPLQREGATTIREAWGEAVDKGRAAHVRMLQETAPARHQKGYVLQSPVHKVADLFGLEDRQSASPGSDLAVVACALQDTITKLHDALARIAVLEAN